MECCGQHTFGDCVVDDYPLTATRARWMWTAAQRSTGLPDLEKYTVLVLAFGGAMATNAGTTGWKVSCLDEERYRMAGEGSDSGSGGGRELGTAHQATFFLSPFSSTQGIMGRDEGRQVRWEVG